MSVGLALGLSGVAWAQDPDTSEPEAEDDAEEVVVTAYRFSGAGGDAPYATTTLGPSEITNGRPTLELGEALAQVPGVFVSNRFNFAQDSRLSIRGFGARAPFGIRGIRVVMDGIPLTLPDGQSQIDSVDPANIGQIDVLRGPAGSLYGNAAGGVLVLQTRRPTDGPELDLFQTVGQFNTVKSAVSARTTTGDTDVSLFVSRTGIGGWRDQSSVEHVAAQSHVATQISPNVRWSANVHYVRAPVADDPGGLTEEDRLANPQQAAQTNLDFGTGEDLSQVQAGTRLIAEVNGAHQFEVVGHAGVRTFDGRIPFRIVEFDRDFYGGLGVYRWRAGNDAVQNQLAVGLEVQAQQDDRRNEGNDGGVPNGVPSLNQSERATNLGVFVQDRLSPVDRLVLLGSARYDRVSFRLDDKFLADGDNSGQRVMDQVTGQGGVLVRIADGFSAFANVSQSFETPTLSELVNADGESGLDPDLQPQTALSIEGGGRYGSDRVEASLAVFGMNLTNELIAQEDDEGRAFFVNTGQSRRLGAEAFARVQLAEAWEVRGSYTWLRAEFRDDDRLGNRIPGIPEHRAFGRLRWSQFGVHAAGELEYIGSIAANDANDAEAPSVALLGARVGYTWSPSKHVDADLTLGVRNLLGVDYVDNVRINAFGGRFFEPGLPRHVYGALTIGFQ